jgi:mannose-6-phosphate isomerase-like protein (cupin superfamily)
MRRSIGSAAGLLLALTACAPAYAQQRAPSKPSSILSEQNAKRQDFEWGSLITYAEGETYGSKDGLAAVAIIKPGQEIHPPHKHAEEEYVIVTEGTGTWFMNGRESPAKAGDVQYAAPWDLHGLRNTGTTPLRFFVWKWNGKGVPVPIEPK